MHDYTCPKSCIPQIWPEMFRNPQKISQQFSHPVPSWVNNGISFLIPRSWMLYGFHTPGFQLLQFSYPGQFPSALVPGIKNDRSLAISTKTLKRDIFQVNTWNQH